MPEGRYNSITRSGVIVEDPSYIVRLENSEEWLGGYIGGEPIKTTVDYLLHRIRGVTLGELSGYYKENGHPDLIAQIDTGDRVVNQRFTWDEDSDDYKRTEEDNGST